MICDAPTGSDGTWGSAGVILFDGRGSDPIMRVLASGGVAAAQVKCDSTQQMLQLGWPEFLPDGKHFVYLSVAPTPTLRVGDLGSAKGRGLGPV